MKGQKRNRGGRKMNLFTSLVDLLDFMIHETSVVKKDIFFEHLYGPP